MAGQAHKSSLFVNWILTNKPIFRSSGWPGPDFHWFPIRFWSKSSFFRSSCWQGPDLQRFSIIFQLILHYFSALPGQAQLFIDFQLHSDWKFIISELWLPSSRFSLISNYILINDLLFRSSGWQGPDFHLPSVKILCKTRNVRALAGQSQIVTDVRLHSHYNLFFRSYGWPGPDVHRFSVRCLSEIHYITALAGQAQISINFQFYS